MLRSLAQRKAAEIIRDARRAVQKRGTALF
jgi:hypothetical protein